MLNSRSIIRHVRMDLLLCAAFKVAPLRLGGLVSKETVVLRRWGSDTRKFGLSTELIM